MTAINSQGGDVQLHTPKAPTVGPCSDEQNGSAVAAPLQTVRMLTDEECEEVSDMRSLNIYEDYANLQRKFCEVNGINPPAGGERGQA